MQILTADPALEYAYQALFDNFQLLKRDRPLKTILLTSTQPEEGKTTVAVMLALTAVMAGSRVLLVDADVRKPKVHRMLGLHNQNGLADFLAGSAEAHDAIQKVDLTPALSADAAGSLSVMTSGNAANPSAVLSLGSPRLKALLDGLVEQFDFILLDSAPVLAVTDPLFIAPMTDGVLFVIAAGTVPEADTKQARQRLEEAGGKILGVVMNRFNKKLHGSSMHPYYESHYAVARPGR